MPGLVPALRGVIYTMDKITLEDMENIFHNRESRKSRDHKKDV
jgi:hypothetical protein